MRQKDTPRARAAQAPMETRAKRDICREKSDECRLTWRAMKRLEFHPLANIFPLLEGAEFEGFVADVRAHGVREPIWIYERKILDGRNRYRAAGEASVACPTRSYEGNDPVGFVVSMNLKRRHLPPSERSMVAARMATLPHGANQWTGKFAAPSQADAAKLVGVSERMVRSARAVIEHAVPELVQAVDHGRIAVHDAEKAARESVDVQEQFLAATAAGKTFINWRHDYLRRKHAGDLAATATALPVGEKRWPLILADPPWDYENLIPLKSRNHPSDLYATMTDAERFVFEAPSANHINGRDKVRHCRPQEQHAIVGGDVAYRQRANLVWDKEIPGLGYWVRGQHELLLIASKGNPPKPPTDCLSPSVIRERRREHSRKPEAAYAIIERMYPDLPKIELFARHARPGWSCWGNEAPKAEDEEAA